MHSGLTTSQAQAWVQAVAGCGRLPTLPRVLSSFPLPTLAPAKWLQVGPETANRLGPRHMKVCESLTALILGARINLVFESNSRIPRAGKVETRATKNEKGSR